MAPRTMILWLRLAIGFVWVYTGMISLFVYPLPRSLDRLARVGITGPWGPWTVYLTSVLEVFLGVAMMVDLWVLACAWIQIVLMIAFTIIITARLPEFWIDPFGPMAKNVPLLVSTVILLRLVISDRHPTPVR